MAAIIGALYLRVNYLENRQKIFASLPANSRQIPQGNLEKIGLSDYVRGNKDASVTLVEYSDFECPSCQRMHPVYDKILQKFGSSVRFVQRMFPLPQNINAEKEAEAVLCAGKIGGEKTYWKYGDEIFKRTTGKEGGEGFALDKLLPLAKELGVSEKAFGKCLDKEEMAGRVQKEKKSGEIAGVVQLPSLFILTKNNQNMLVSGEESFQTLQLIVSYAIQE